MAKAGRNDPCSCGSGRKYKQCCLEQDRAAELAPAIAQRVALQAQADKLAAERVEALAALQESQALDAASNAVVDLVHAGRFDEAEQGAHKLLLDYPDVPDGHDRLGMVYEAQGRFLDAADCYRRVIAVAQADPDNFDPGYIDMFNELIAKLDARAIEADPTSGIQVQ